MKGIRGVHSPLLFIIIWLAHAGVGTLGTTISEGSTMDGDMTQDQQAAATAHQDLIGERAMMFEQAGLRVWDFLHRGRGEPLDQMENGEKMSTLSVLASAASAPNDPKDGWISENKGEDNLDEMMSKLRSFEEVDAASADPGGVRIVEAVVLSRQDGVRQVEAKSGEDMKAAENEVHLEVTGNLKGLSGENYKSGHVINNYWKDLLKSY